MFVSYTGMIKSFLFQRNDRILLGCTRLVRLSNELKLCLHPLLINELAGKIAAIPPARLVLQGS